MKNSVRAVLLTVGLSCSLPAFAGPLISPWHFEMTPYTRDIQINPDLANGEEDYVEDLRTGFYAESSATPFKGCVLYLEGLADSVANQGPLFNYLSQNGYRTVFFDYMGQGGSTGSMDDTRVFSIAAPFAQISEMALTVWSKYSDAAETFNGHSCAGSKKLVMGWSTGGLAAYGLAHDNWADAVVLIAPGIAVKTFVGESKKFPYRLFLFKGVISERSLTTCPTGALGVDPHVEPIKPNNPLKVPGFSLDLVDSAKRSQTWTISDRIPGLVFLGGPDDTFIDSPKVRPILATNTKFTVVNYPNGRHELQNECADISSDLYKKTVDFLNSVAR
jgi:alpha-beta hydrolase superfamily lysophospholipase